ncbi:DUF2795 domain-containing protein [Patescibacteria group bacterium]|nr:DUF2795 domain-containing protein [Patescibacteria group bacterium]
MTNGDQGGADMLGPYLADLNFPVTKEEIINHAKEMEASERVIELLQKLPDKEYNAADEITDAVSEE